MEREWRAAHSQPRRQVKALEPNRIVLKGKLALHFWWWPTTVKIAVIDTYYVSAGPTENSTTIEYFGRVHGKGVGVMFAPMIKPEWRRVKEEAREGLARQMGRPMEAPKPVPGGLAVPQRGMGVSVQE